ncbi:hypothetical protein HK096_004161 [Nowakowskiella sp. JEL0078]|nr:hypothetical protein HK096_004161 [Nowakowskiella sp. JEL0078]
MSSAMQRYIVVLHESAKLDITENLDKIVAEITKLGGRVHHKFTLIAAVSCELPGQIVEFVKRLPLVSSVEIDGIVHTQDDN